MFLVNLLRIRILLQEFKVVTLPPPLGSERRSKRNYSNRTKARKCSQEMAHSQTFQRYTKLRLLSWSRHVVSTFLRTPTNLSAKARPARHKRSTQQHSRSSTQESSPTSNSRAISNSVSTYRINRSYLKCVYRFSTEERV